MTAVDDLETTDSPGENKSGSLTTLIGVVAALTVIAAGGGWFMGNSLPMARVSKPAAAAPASAHGTEAARVEEHDAASGGSSGQVVPLKSILVSLAAPASVWVRLETALVSRPGEEISSETAALVAGDFTAYINTLSLSQITGATGLQYLREDLEERARMRSDGRVDKVVITSLVME